MCKCLIIGCGTVGTNLCTEISALNPDTYDKYKKIDSRPYKLSPVEDTMYATKTFSRYDVAFICVDTPLVDDNMLDTTEVINALQENDAEIYVIKSTCPVGTTTSLSKKLHKRIVYSPEYYGGTQHCNKFEFNFTILGGETSDCIEVQQLLQECYDARHTFHIVDSDTAELVKLMENSWIATKVSFCTQFYNIAQDYNIKYEQLRELFILDPRVNPSHTFVYRDHPYWDSHCLNKDMPYTSSLAGAELLKSICKFNETQKERFNTPPVTFDDTYVPSIMGLDPTTGEWGHNS